jgi:hypothetical protein
MFVAHTFPIWSQASHTAAFTKIESFTVGPTKGETDKVLEKSFFPGRQNQERKIWWRSGDAFSEIPLETLFSACHAQGIKDFYPHPPTRTTGHRGNRQMHQFGKFPR